MLTSARLAAIALACCAVACSKQTPDTPPAPRPVPVLGGMPLAGTDTVAKTHGFTDCHASSNLDSLVCKYPKALQFDEIRADFAEVILDIKQSGGTPSASYSGITFYFPRNSEHIKCPKPKRHPGDQWADVASDDCPPDRRLDAVLEKLAAEGWVSGPSGRALYHRKQPYYAQFDRGTTQGAHPSITIIPLDDASEALVENALQYEAQLEATRSNAAKLVEKMRPAK